MADADEGIEDSEQVQQAGDSGIENGQVIRPVADQRGLVGLAKEIGDDGVETGQNLGAEPINALRRIDNTDGADV